MLFSWLSCLAWDVRLYIIVRMSAVKLIGVMTPLTVTNYGVHPCMTGDKNSDFICLLPFTFSIGKYMRSYTYFNVYFSILIT